MGGRGGTGVGVYVIHDRGCMTIIGIEGEGG